MHKQNKANIPNYAANHSHHAKQVDKALRHAVMTGKVLTIRKIRSHGSRKFFFLSFNLLFCFYFFVVDIFCICLSRFNMNVRGAERVGVK